MDISKRIRTKRKAMGLTTTALAKQVGCTPEYVSMIECGKLPKKTDRGYFAAIKRALKVRGGGQVVVRKPRESKAVSVQLSQAIGMLQVLTEETRALAALVRYTHATKAEGGAS